MLLFLTLSFHPNEEFSFRKDIMCQVFYGGTYSNLLWCSRRLFLVSWFLETVYIILFKKNKQKNKKQNLN